MRVVVIGAHGRTGRLVVSQLHAAGHDVIGTVRQEEHLQELRDAGSNGVFVDLLTSTRADFAAPFHGADAVVYTAGSGRGSPAEVVERLDRDAIIDAADAAVEAGINRFIVVSAHRTDEDHGPDTVVHLLRAKRAADAHIRSTSLGWTVIRPDDLTEDPPEGTVHIAAKVPRGSLAREDLADVIVTTLINDLARRAQFEIVGGSDQIRQAIQSFAEVS